MAAHMSVEAREIVLAGRRTRVIEAQGAGPAIVLLHGFSDSAETWRPLMELLATTRRRLVAVDLPGFGAAEPLGTGALLPQFDEFVAAAIGEWTDAGEGPVVVGNSLGGLLAMRAEQTPGIQLSGLVLISPAGLDHSPWITFLRYAQAFNPLIFQPLIPMSAYRWLATRAFGYLAGGGVPLVAGTAEAFATQFATPADVARVFASIAPLIEEFRGLADQDIMTPTLVLWGRHDRLTTVSGADRLRGWLRAGSVVILDDCGHCAHLQRPDVIAAHIAEFLQHQIDR